MKELRGSASGSSPAPAERTLDLLADVEAYPQWYPDVVREVTILERGADGRGTRARATLQVSVGPLSRALALTLDVARDPTAVRLVRVPHERSDKERFSVTWRVTGEATGSRIDLALDAALDLPRLMPLPSGIGDTLAQGFVTAAVNKLSE